MTDELHCSELAMELERSRNMNGERHRCDVCTPARAYGVAINYCYEDESGYLWAGNGEYESGVQYCPFCGYKALNPCKQTPGEEY